MTKLSFTKQFLEPLVKHLTNGNVTRVCYEKRKDGEEYVHILYQWDDGMGNTQGITKKICVTADSERAMLIDIIKKI